MPCIKQKTNIDSKQKECEFCFMQLKGISVDDYNRRVHGSETIRLQAASGEYKEGEKSWQDVWAELRTAFGNAICYGSKPIEPWRTKQK